LGVEREGKDEEEEGGKEVGKEVGGGVAREGRESGEGGGCAFISGDLRDEEEEEVGGKGGEWP